MIVNLEKYRLKRQEEQAYRLELVEQIKLCHQSKPESERADAFYFEHIRAHFSIDMLEDILRRLQQKASNE
jgi:predicted SAM-dependent methyltransferase